jgi:hypothetical protein
VAVRSQEINRSAARSPAARKGPTLAVPPISLHTVAYLIVTLLALVAIYAIMGRAISWVGERVDDLRYGSTRTVQLDAVVGHDDGEGTPTHLIAMNLNRQVLVIEIPGGDASKIRTLIGPYLFGAGEDKTPVRLRLEDLNRDGAKDLIVSVKNEEIVYLNRDNEFKPITPEERAQLVRGS